MITLIYTAAHKICQHLVGNVTGFLADYPSSWRQCLIITAQVRYRKEGIEADAMTQIGPPSLICRGIVWPALRFFENSLIPWCDYNANLSRKLACIV